ncbi:MAG: hypothetical protein JSS93_12080 [Bacteroidetes bacterium]|nr:hypothetical protein [Bacteroidota bacterium]
MRKKILFIIVFFYPFITQGQTPADSVSKHVQFILKNGQQVNGKILMLKKEKYLIETSSGDTVTVEQAQIKTISVPGLLGRGYYENQFSYKYFMFNSAVPLAAKKWYFSNQYLFFSSINYGINSHFSAGCAFFSFNPPALFSPKVRYTLNPNSKIKVGINAQYLSIQVSEISAGKKYYQYGLAQAVATYGSSQNNFTLGVGKFISNRGVYGGYVVLLGVAKKIAPRLSFISENNFVLGSLYFSNNFSLLSNRFGFLSAGFRFDHTKHAFDLGLISPGVSEIYFNMNRVFIFPFVGYHLKLNP